MAAKQKTTVRTTRTRTRKRRSSTGRSGGGKRRCPTCGRYM